MAPKELSLDRRLDAFLDLWEQLVEIHNGLDTRITKTEVRAALHVLTYDGILEPEELNAVHAAFNGNAPLAPRAHKMLQRFLDDAAKLKGPRIGVNVVEDNIFNAVLKLFGMRDYNFEEIPQDTPAGIDHQL